MKHWDDLTETGRFRRLRPLAGAALDNYAIGVRGLRFVGGFANAIFRVDTDTGPYALRIDYLQDHPDESTEVELAWLDALAADTDLDVARVVHARTGATSVRATAHGVPGSRRCTLFEWIPGKPLADGLTPERYHQLGCLSAGLRIHGAGFEPPRRPMSWDRIFYWPEDIDPVVFRLPEHAHHFSGGRMDLLDDVIAAVEPAFAKLDPGTAQIIHGDLHPWNVHYRGSRLIALDFEDVTWGHPVQDVAITLFYERDHAAYPELRAAFEAGYRSTAEWPVSYPGELEHFMAARTVMFINYVLNLGEDPTEFYESAFARLQRFLDTWAG